MHVQSDRGKVAMRSMAAARVRSRAHKPGPSGSAEKEKTILNLEPQILTSLEQTKLRTALEQCCTYEISGERI